MTQPSVPMSPYPQAGEVIDGKYQVERLLGEGGMGAVARAQHLLRRAPVALKFMSPMVLNYPGAVERFLNEGVAASQIDSENVVKVFDVGKLPSGAPYLVMECLEGRDLSELLQREGRPGLESVPRAVHFVLQALRGLQVAHEAGIVHRDMKPSNCFVIDKDGEPDFVKLLDFGISKVQQSQGGGSLTATNSALGTPLYMSPEQAKSARQVDLRSDLYSCAVILYELLTGRTPFTSDTGEFTEILFKIFTTDPPPIQSMRPDLPEAFCQAIHRGLARDPANRFASAAEMCEALVPWADERSRQVVTRIRHRASNQGRPTPHSELGSQVHLTQGGSRAVVTGPTPGMTAQDMLGSTAVGAPAITGVSTAPATVQDVNAPGAEGRTAVSAGEVGATSLDARRRTNPAAFIVPGMLAFGVLVGFGAWKLWPAPPASPPSAEIAPANDPAAPGPTAAVPAPSAAPVVSAAPAPSASATVTDPKATPVRSSQVVKSQPAPVDSKAAKRPPRLNEINLHE